MRIVEVPSGGLAIAAVPIEDIRVGPSRRTLRDIGPLKESIEQVGLMSPILIRRSGELLAGLHRLEACKALGWGTIPAYVIECDDLHAELVEIDENLIRNELTVLERSEQLRRRKAIYEELHPETKAGTAGANAKHGHATEIISFANDTAAKTNVTPRTVRQEVQIAESIDDDVKEVIRDTPLADRKADLVKLAQVKDKAKQRDIVAAIADGKAKDVEQAKREIARQEKRETLKAKAREVDAAAKADDAPPPWRIVAGDCLEILPTIEPGSVRLAFADPPYNIGIDYGDHYDDSRPADEFQRWCSDWMADVHRTLADDGSFWLLVNHEWAWMLCGEAVETIGFHLRQWLTWYESFGVNCTGKFNRCSRALLWLTKDRERFVFNRDAVTRPSDRLVKYGDKRADPGGKVWDDVWGINPPIPRVVDNNRERIPDFPTQLPLGLLRAVVGCASEPGDLVIDPFNGSGTTGAACVELGRRYVGIEKSERFAEVATMRLKAHGSER